jgi:chromosome segregation ATPase
MLQSPAGVREQQRSDLEGATSSPYRSLSPAARAPLQDAWRQRDVQTDWHKHHQQQPELNGHTYAPRLRFTEPLLDLLRQLEAQNADLEADRQAADERATDAEARIDTLQQELDVFREQASRARVEAVSAQSTLAARQDELARRLQEVARQEAEAAAQAELVLEQVRQRRHACFDEFSTQCACCTSCTNSD